MKQVIDILKLKSNQDIDDVADHNLRKVPSKNVNAKKSKLNKFYIGSADMNVSQQLENILATVPKPRKDANRMVNLVLSASPEFYETATKKSIDDWEKATQKWAEDYFGKENILYSVVHNDEKTKHFHIAIVPIFEGKLRSNHWFDGPAKLNALHNSYAKINKKFGIQRGQKAVKAEHTDLQDYYKKVNATKKYEDNLDKQVEEFLQVIKNPTFTQKITPWKFVDEVITPFISRLTTNLKHYRAKSKSAEKTIKDLKLAHQKIDDMSLKLNHLGLSDQTTFEDCLKLQPTVLAALQKRTLPTEEGFDPIQLSPKHQVQPPTPKFH